MRGNYPQQRVRGEAKFSDFGFFHFVAICKLKKLLTLDLISGESPNGSDALKTSFGDFIRQPS